MRIRNVAISVAVLAAVGAAALLLRTRDVRTPSVVMPAADDLWVESEASGAPAAAVPASPRERAALEGGPLRGRVVLRTPADETVPVAASVKCIACAAATLPSEEQVARAQPLRCRDDGTFAIELDRIEHAAGVDVRGDDAQVFCLAEHEDGVTSYAKTSASAAGEVVVELAAAGKVEVRIPDNRELAELVLTPATPASSRPRPARLRVTTRDASVRVGGIPLAWGRVNVSARWESGQSLAGSGDLVFRAWTVIGLGAGGEGRIHGTITDAARAPIAGARGYLYSGGPQFGGDLAEYYATADEQGRFSFERLPATRYVAQLGTAKRLSVRIPLELQAGEDRDLGAIALADGVTLVGRVIADSYDGTSVALLPKHGELVHAGDVLHCVPAAGRRTPVGADGRFTFDTVGSGTQVLAAFRGEPQQFGTPWSGTEVVVAEAARGEVEVPPLEMGGLRPWRARFVELAGIEPSLVIARGIARPWCAYGALSPERTVDIPVWEGTFLVGLKAEGAIRWLAVADAQTTTVELHVGGLTVCGSEPLPDGTYAVDLTLLATPRPDWAAVHLPLEIGVLTQQVANGRTSVAGLLPGSYEVRLERHRRTGSARVEVVEGGVAEVAVTLR